MRINTIFTVLILASLASLGVAAASAQADVAASVYGAFTGTTTGNGTQQSPSNSAGVLFEVRHIANPILGFEGTYSYNRADQTYSCHLCVTPLACPTSGCLPGTPVSVPANAHEITADWIPSLHIANLRPFGVLGVGVLLNVPTSANTAVSGGLPDDSTLVPTQTSTKAVYVYGAGLDWGVLPHIGLRFQYRGNLYKAPDLTALYGSTNSFTHTAEPMVGVYFRL
ncbi:MAG TPA: outer membrane beta-barrel protein [Acidobacteriaceae bacterium]|jgi:opacity protein-like surface antigen|nr:outer membrane beta-barrel protein [Acidobacteriaceae bacterium]